MSDWEVTARTASCKPGAHLKDDGTPGVYTAEVLIAANHVNWEPSKSIFNVPMVVSFTASASDQDPLSAISRAHSRAADMWDLFREKIEN